MSKFSASGGTPAIGKTLIDKNKKREHYNIDVVLHMTGFNAIFEIRNKIPQSTVRTPTVIDQQFFHLYK